MYMNVWKCKSIFGRWLFKTVYWLLRQTFNVSALTEGSLVSIICVGGVSQESPVVTVRVCGD